MKRSDKTSHSSAHSPIHRVILRLFSHTSMRSKLIFLYVFTMVIIITLLVMVVQSMGFSILEHQTTSQLTALAASKANQISVLLEQDLERTSLISSRTQMRDSLVAFVSDSTDPEPNRIRIMNIIIDAAASVDSIRSVDVLNTQGTVVASTSPALNNQILSEQPTFQAGLTGTYQSDIYWDLLGRPYYYLSMPLYHTTAGNGETRQVIGVVRVEMSLERMMSVLSDYTGLGQMGDIILVSQENGQILALNPLRDSQHEPLVPITISNTLPVDGDNNWADYAFFKDSNSLLAYAPITSKHHNWGILTRINSGEMLAPYQTLSRYFIAFSIGLLLTGSVIILAGIRFSFTNIDKLLEGAGYFGRGNLDHRIELQQKDEMGELADSFNDMAGKLKEIQDQMLHLSFNDQLTGLGNRRFFEEELIRLDIPRHLPLTILMGDINGLKLTNDAFGHATGDELLQKAAGILRGECQEQDVVCRVGGDEFIALLPNTTALDADAIVRRIKNHLNQTKVANIDLSISFGHDTKEHPKEHIREILETAEEKMYGVKLSESKTMRSKTIEVILDTFFRNREERRHAHAVASLSESIGMALNFPEERRESLKKAGMFHDLGNIAIDPSLLHQENPLSEKDWSEIKRHPEIGYRILSGSSEYQEIAEQLLGHHEHWDGTGYPRKLKGEEIPIESRIIAIAEAYDTMTHEQLYSPALSNQEAVDELKAQSGIQFDPGLVTLVVYKVL